MDRQKLIQHVAIVLTDVLGREIPELTEEARLFEDLALDSTSIIELLMGLEDTMDIEVNPDDLTPETFANVGSLVDYLQSGLRPVAA